ncbi:3-oxoadipate enol-lactonase [Aminobacter sp. DSM 101952]|uniref:3-oxoadipate enol-lactonase n=1 Tax=Aminobacter sp. DSM 101952 TaxID=2735891 RepID=UPI0009EA2F53|nr:3-oxoadipate enol-lactonase [Aminobacter sp. DSM 101952]
MSFARTNGVVLHYRRLGRSAGPRMVFANSLGSDLAIWDDVADELGRDFDLLFYDKRGHGLSEVAPAPRGIADHADDLAGLLDHVGWGSAAVCGLSVGGLIAMDMAVRAPERVTRLVLLDTAARIGTPEAWNARIEAVLHQGVAAIGDQIMERWFSPAYRDAEPDAFAGWQRMLERTPAKGYADTCRALRDADLTGAIAGIVAPTLVIAGDEDLSTPPELVADTARRIPAAAFRTIAGAGHLPCIERPGDVAGLLRDFLSQRLPAAEQGGPRPRAYDKERQDGRHSLFR